VADQAGKAIRAEIRSWHLHLRSDKAIEDLKWMFNPIIRGVAPAFSGIMGNFTGGRSIRRCANWIDLWPTGAERKYQKLRSALLQVRMPMQP
jgi:hypothetical protein